MLYLDHGATTAMYPQVVDEMLPYFSDLYANPSSAYEFGGDAKAMVECVRRQIGESISATPEEIYFTSGGTESDNWALVGIAEGLKAKGKHLITSCTEHHAILHTCKYLEERGFEVTYLPVNQEGEISLSELEQAIREDTILISIMFANNEIGTIQPVGEIGEIARKHGVLFHTDAVQAYLHEPIDVEKLKIDLLSASSHKFYGPKGVGFLYVRRDTGITSFMHGGGQERGHRAGTENVAGIIGMGKAVSIGRRNFEENHRRLTAMRDYLLHEIKEKIPDCRINGSEKHRLDANVSVSFKYLEGQSLILLLDMEGIYVSGGSACAAHHQGVSHVLQGIGLPEEWARGTVRITLGVDNTMEEMEFFARRLRSLVGQLREFSDEYTASKQGI